MATQFQIPDIYRPGFTVLANLSDPLFDKLKTYLNDAQIGEDEESLSNKIFPPLKISAIEGKDLSSTVFSLYYLVLQNTNTALDIAGGLAKSYSSSSPEIKTITESTLSSRINEIITLKSNILYAVKSQILYGESYSIFEDSRIVSDIRLTFDNYTTDYSNRGGVVIHNLKLTFRENSESNDIFISCVKKDLIKLKSTIDRALEKEKTITEGNLSKEITFVEIK